MQLILNLEAFDNSIEHNSAILKYSLFRETDLHPGGKLQVNFKSISNMKTSRKFSSKISHVQKFSEEVFIDSLSTIRVCFYLYKVCLRHKSRRKILEKHYSGICTLLDENLKFDFTDGKLIFDNYSTSTSKLFDYVQKYKDENVAYIDLKILNIDCFSK